jgi:type II secretory pathway pseudopilin PulG
MPIGKSSGFGYLGLLFFVAITAAALAALGQAWSTAAERERERELEFRGNEIARAIASFVKAGPHPPAAYPKRLEDLILDQRSLVARHHLRRVYPDPFTGQPDWVLVPEPSQPGAFAAVRSRSTQVLLRNTTPDGSTLRKAEDWIFDARAHDAQADSPPVAASAVALPSSATLR